MRRPNRLLAAAALCIVSLGLPWGISMAYTGWSTSRLMLIPSFDWASGEVSAPSTAITFDYYPGDPRAAAPGAASNERVVLVPAAIAFAAAGLRPSSSTRRRWAKGAAVTLAVVAALGLARGIPGGPLVALLAVALVAPSMNWRQSRRSASAD